ncbi:unnamed protein product [Polarella glacialis]|uniref:Uncharacterized protein n=1 Tax=Polarella glacialis TaxID=89957 RepID=A0A813JYW4_POLGL|nr:unnamed protein product [Polarella glacialis]
MSDVWHLPLAPSSDCPHILAHTRSNNFLFWFALFLLLLLLLLVVVVLLLLLQYNSMDLTCVCGAFGIQVSARTAISRCFGVCLFPVVFHFLDNLGADCR